MIPILLYTHSEYSFLWKAAIPLLEKYAKNFTIYWCCDVDVDLPANFILHKYDVNDTWSFRVKGCLQTIKTDYVLYIQEDWLLIDEMVPEKLTYLTEYMQERHIDFLMCYERGHVSEWTPSIYPDYTFCKIQGHYFQPALWKYDILMRILEMNIPMYENENAANLVTQHANCYAIVYNKSRDRSIPALYFPHMHAIHNGRWTFIKYPGLKAFVESFGIDTSTRGVSDNWICDYQ